MILMIVSGLVLIFAMGAISMYSSLRYSHDHSYKQNISEKVGRQV